MQLLEPTLTVMADYATGWITSRRYTDRDMEPVSDSESESDYGDVEGINAIL